MNLFTCSGILACVTWYTNPLISRELVQALYNAVDKVALAFNTLLQGLLYSQELRYFPTQCTSVHNARTSTWTHCHSNLADVSTCQLCVNSYRHFHYQNKHNYNENINITLATTQGYTNCLVNMKIFKFSINISICLRKVIFIVILNIHGAKKKNTYLDIVVSRKQANEV